MSCWSQTARFSLSFGAILLLASCGRRGDPLPKLDLVPSFDLTREDGSAFSSALELKGQVWIADFIYTNCPGPCPRMTQHMKRLQDQTAGIDKLRFVSITVDPEADTPPVLSAYAKRFGADSRRWCFLTGTRQELHHLSKEVFKLGDVAPDLEHSTRFVLVDKESRIRGYYGTSDASFAGRLLDDAKSLLKE